MLKRAIATALWFLAGWTMTAIVAYAVGLPEVLTPVAASVAAGLVWFGPPLPFRGPQGVERVLQQD